MSDIILFEFAGRRANVELQLPFFHRILDEHQNVRIELWNLAFRPDDNEYVRSLAGRHDRMTVINDFYGERPFVRFNDVYRHYAKARFDGCLFVKLDDDVVFIETERFGEFVSAINTNRDAVVSAQVINNGACTKVEPKLWAQYRSNPQTGLLDVHRSHQYAAMCHEFFFNNWPSLIGQPVETIFTEDWLSINLIGYTWGMGVRIASLLETPSPKIIAGRRFPRRNAALGDEGVVSMLPRRIVKGFLACHLTFGPQELRMPNKQATLNRWRARYQEIGEKYLHE